MRPFEVLLVEDNAGDVRLTREALNECARPFRLTVVQDGIQALEYLRSTKERAGAHLPDVILLDWNLPGLDGRDVLLAVKSDERLRNIPVIVLTTSDAPADVQRAYDLHANCFITKPVNVHRFFDIISEVEHFWLNTATLPSR